MRVPTQPDGEGVDRGRERKTERGREREAPAWSQWKPLPTPRQEERPR